MLKILLQAMGKLLAAEDIPSREDNPYAPPRISIPGKIICGLDLSTSIGRRSEVMASAWEHQLLNRLQSLWPDLQMLLFGVNSKVWPLPPCEDRRFQPLSKITRYCANDFTQARLLAGGSAFYDYLVEASELAIELVEQQQRNGTYFPVMVCLLCDGEPRLSKATSKEAFAVMQKARKKGVAFRISCFVPDHHHVVQQMNMFRDSLRLTHSPVVKTLADLKSAPREEFFLITEAEDDPEESVTSCVEQISESILRIGYENQEP